MNWPQAKVPFDDAARSYIAGVDVDADLATLAAHGIELRQECVHVMRATTAVLQQGAARCLAPLPIAQVMCRCRLHTGSRASNCCNYATCCSVPGSCLSYQTNRCTSLFCGCLTSCADVLFGFWLAEDKRSASRM